MTEEEFIIKYPWIDPTVGYPSRALIPGLSEVDKLYIGVKIGAAHKTIKFIEPARSHGLDKVEGFDWELFVVSYEGIVNHKAYYWGKFVEGIVLFNIMVPFEHARFVESHELAPWSKLFSI